MLRGMGEGMRRQRGKGEGRVKGRGGWEGGWARGRKDKGRKGRGIILTPNLAEPAAEPHGGTLGFAGESGKEFGRWAKRQE